ncbi:L,D-transpeptidase family protein [Alkalihalobacterium sp. APHAB7]|uniref:L,D-transpeptidase family protein n=1 Tax=Alkalihalobacterium sp. APHAB7 TaxID=3402081 RepID=UPI003AAF5530
MNGRVKKGFVSMLIMVFIFSSLSIPSISFAETEDEVLAEGALFPAELEVDEITPDVHDVHNEEEMEEDPVVEEKLTDIGISEEEAIRLQDDHLEAEEEVQAEIQPSEGTTETQPSEDTIEEPSVEKMSQVVTMAAFTASTKYFEVINENIPVYDNRTGSLVEVGWLKKGEVYPRVRDYGPNWHEIRYGNGTAYVRKADTKPANGAVLRNKNKSFVNTTSAFVTRMNVEVYDNTSGGLIPFGVLKQGRSYPIVGSFGPNWYRVLLADRVGYVRTSEVLLAFRNSDQYFQVTQDAVEVYDNRSGSLVKVGELMKGQVYPRTRAYGANWHEIEFGNIKGYVRSASTRPATNNSLRNENRSFKNGRLVLEAKQNMEVYDNTSGKLVPFAQLQKGIKYPIVGEFGPNWYRIVVANRVGFVRSSEVNITATFTAADQFFQVVEEDTVVYDNRSGSLVAVGTLKKGQVYPRVRDYGPNWHQIKFGDKFGYVSKAATIPTNGASLRNVNKSFSNTNANFTTLESVPVYDNTSGRLIEYGTLAKGVSYPIVSDYGNWYRILLSDRVGYVAKSAVSLNNYTDPILSRLSKYTDREQAIVVTSSSWTTTLAKVQTYEKAGDIWRPVRQYNAVLGRSGFMRDKREGDGGTPIGMYDLGTAFGWGSKPAQVQYPYQRTTTTDYWVDDVTSADYNQWISFHGNPNSRWKSFERLNHELYKYALHIKYNENPIVKGNGSAIFMHVWRASTSPTAGCVAVSENDMVRILQWLDQSKNPAIFMGPNSVIQDIIGQ